MVETESVEGSSGSRDLRREFLRSMWRLGIAVSTGFTAGAVIGGVGGRLAMFVLRLTSSPSLRGRRTDDDFIIGRFSGDTIFLVGLCALAGIAAALLYLMIRAWLPERRRPLYAGAFFGLVGGTLIVKPEGIDFTRLDPLPLAIAMFVILPGLYGVVTAWSVEKWAERAGPQSTRAAWILPLVMLLPLIFGALFGLGLVVILVLAWFINQQLPLTAMWRSQVVTWIGRVALLGVGLLSAVTLVKDSIEIL